LIGGGGERKTLRLVAQYGDATHQTTADPEVMRHKMAVLRSHCEQLGRNYDEIERYCGLDLHGDGKSGGKIAPAGLLLERTAALEESGAHGVFFVLPDVADSDAIEQFGRNVIGRA
jgi:hypothetical protein